MAGACKQCCWNAEKTFGCRRSGEGPNVPFDTPSISSGPLFTILKNLRRYASHFGAHLCILCFASWRRVNHATVTICTILSCILHTFFNKFAPFGANFAVFSSTIEPAGAGLCLNGKLEGAGSPVPPFLQGFRWHKTPRDRKGVQGGKDRDQGIWIKGSRALDGSPMGTATYRRNGFVDRTRVSGERPIAE